MVDYYHMLRRIDEIQQESDAAATRAHEEIARARRQIERVDTLLEKLARDRAAKRN